MLGKLLRWFGIAMLVVGGLISLVTAVQIADVRSHGRPVSAGLVFLWTTLSGSLWAGLSSLALAKLLERK